ncbi:hypothetical protein Tco_1136886, partial [Tanacetum coccineum]
MYGFKECSSCGALYNRERCCSIVSSVDNYVRDPNPISYNKTPFSSQQHPRNCSKCGGPFGGLYCRQCTCKRCRRNYTDEVCASCCYEIKKSFVHDSNPNSFIDSTNNFNPPPQPQYQTNSCELCGNDAHFGYDCPTQVPDPLIQQHEQAVQKEQEEQAAFTPYWRIPIIDDDDDEYTIQYKEYLENSSKAITPDLSTEEPDNSLSMGDEHLDTILETESDEVIKSSVEDLVPIPSESEGIFDNMCDEPFCNKNHFDAESDLMESLLHRDTSIVYSPKIDSLLKEFTGKLAYIDLIPPEINKADFNPKDDNRLIEQLLCDSSLPLNILNDHFEIFSDFNDDCTSSDDDSFENINYIEASPPDSELVSLEEV